MDIFYHAMNYASKGIIDASCCGAFKRRSAKEARQLIEDLAKCNYKAPSEASGSNSGMRRGCKTRENSNFLKNGQTVISVKIRNFSISQMTKRTSPLESSCEI